MGRRTQGLHHVTAISGAAQQNVDFYTGLLGMRLVKRTVNFDDPGTYHLYYGNETGEPGSILTFFPWERAAAGMIGGGMVTGVSYTIPWSALDYWRTRVIKQQQEAGVPLERFGVPVLAFNDPDGLRIELVADGNAVPDRDNTVDNRSDSPWPEIPDEHRIGFFHSVTLHSYRCDQTIRVLTDLFGYEHEGEEDGRQRLRAPHAEAANILDVICAENQPSGRTGRGTIHHIAFRAADEEEQLAWREEIAALGFNVTPVRDRQYFRSIYFREPGGVLFEIATDPPGFLIDEAEESLGTELKLPPWLESQRAEIERRLPDLQVPEWPL